MNLEEYSEQLVTEARGPRGRDVRALQLEWLVDNAAAKADVEPPALAIPGSFNTAWGQDVWRDVSSHDGSHVGSFPRWRSSPPPAYLPMYARSRRQHHFSMYALPFRDMQQPQLFQERRGKTQTGARVLRLRRRLFAVTTFDWSSLETSPIWSAR